MYHIRYDYNEHVNQVISLEDRDTAREVYKAFQTLPGVRNLHGESDEVPKHIAVQVVFRAGGKRYTYLAKSKLAAGDTVVVRTTDGRELVRVVECCEMTDSQLAKLCPLEKLKYIEGVVRAA